MTRATALVLPLLLAAIASVVGGAWVLWERDRGRLAEQFAEERMRQVDDARRAIAVELDDVTEDLGFAAELLAASGSTADHERELRALLQVVKQYQAIGVYGEDGPPDIFIVDPRSHAEGTAGAAAGAMEITARKALLRPLGSIETSPPLGEGGWLRAFAAPVASSGAERRAVAVVVDLEPYFSALRLITSESDTHLLVLGAHGRSVPASDPRIHNAIKQMEEGSARYTALQNTVDQMRAGERGRVRIDDEEAQRLGLGTADIIAAFGPVSPRGGQSWSIATLSSRSALAAVERAVALRFGLAAGAVVLLLVTFGVYVVVASRRVVALRESRRHAARLLHLHEKAQKILDQIPTGVLALSEDGRISSANRMLQQRLGEGCVGKTLREALPLAPAPVVERLVALVDAACAHNRVRTLPGESLALFGEPGQYNVHAVPLENPDPEVRALLVVEDLSNVRELESQLVRAEKLATVGILAAGIAHEIGTPLGVVRGRAEYVIGKLGADAGHAPSLNVIIEQIDRVTRTIRELLDFSRIQPPQTRPVDISQLLRAVEELLRLEADRRKVTLRAHLAELLPALNADPDQLQQVLVNLVMNAFDACEAGGQVVLSADVDPAQEQDGSARMAIRVTDDGCGIPGEKLNQVFDPFFTTKKRGQGTGLGLTIVAQLVRNHGGDVVIDSREGKGTVATVFWPIAKAEERHASA